MNKIVIRHVGGSIPAQFHAVRLVDGKSVGPITVPTPLGFPVEGMPNSHLMRELRWYLETFLDHPFPPFTNRAERILAALQSWGTQAFDALFTDRASGRLLDAATSEQYSDLHLEISSDDPKIHYWPWEALRDSEVGDLAKTCQISRRLNQVRDPHPISKDLPQDQINILLVTARPYEADVRFRSISRPVIDLIVRHKLPAQVTLLRPPTFDQLRSHLRAHPNHYHILHFDGHGGYGPNHGHHDSHSLHGPQGELVFENADGTPAPQKASVLSELLREYSVPVVVLNACQSAMVDEAADDAFASVAASLQKSGVRSVVAMAYSLYVSGAQQFLPAFYQRLFETGNAANAVRAGRQQAAAHPQRVCSRGTFPLNDWLVPVLYEQDAFSLSFAGTAKQVSPPKPDQPTLPDAAQDSENPYGFIGRDGALLALERAMHRPPAGILIQGFGGVGKTTLARGVAQWLATTGGIGQGCFWFSFQEIRSAEYVINELVGNLFGTNALAAPLDQKIAALVDALREHQYLLVWDNFEVVCGIEGTSLQPTLSTDNRQLLLSLLKKLRGGNTKVLITSRSNEDWIDTATCFRLPIGGLIGEERWEYCEAIVRDLGLTVDRTNPDWAKLMDMLDGHPLAMRVILSKLHQSSPSQLASALETNLLQFASKDAESAKLFATLRFVQDRLPPELQRLLVPLALHEQFVDAGYLKSMAKRATEPVDEHDVDRLNQALNVAGLLQERGNGINEMHPALGRYLQLTVYSLASDAIRDSWCRLFVECLGHSANRFGPRKLHEQKAPFHFYGSNYRRALIEAERLGIDDMFMVLVQALASYALNTRDFQDATRQYTRLADHQRRCGDHTGEAVAYHQLGTIAIEQMDLLTADGWYQKALGIDRERGNKRGSASTYYQLGRIAVLRLDYATAEELYRKSLSIQETRGDEDEIAKIYHELGVMAQQQRQWNIAREWYHKSLLIKENRGNEHGAAFTYGQLGTMARDVRDFGTADKFYRRSLAIFEKLNNLYQASRTYQNLAIIAHEVSELAQAEMWCRKSLAISEKNGDEDTSSISYHQMGAIARTLEEFDTAEEWYRKAMSIDEKRRNHQGIAATLYELGSMASQKRDLAAASDLYQQSLRIDEKLKNTHAAAITYGQLARISQERGESVVAGDWIVKALTEFIRSDPYLFQVAMQTLHQVFVRADAAAKVALIQRWQAANLGPWPFEGESTE